MLYWWPVLEFTNWPALICSVGSDDSASPPEGSCPPLADVLEPLLGLPFGVCPLTLSNFCELVRVSSSSFCVGGVFVAVKIIMAEGDSGGVSSGVVSSDFVTVTSHKIAVDLVVEVDMMAIILEI